MKFLPPVGHPNGGRLGNRKERTGCLTCKSSGRECGGYVDPFIPHGASTLSLPKATPITTLAANNDEYRTFNYFAKDRARAIAGPFDVELWSHLIPQLSQTIPAFRPAVMAIGALLLRADKRQTRAEQLATLASSKRCDVFAVEQYQKAIQATIRALDENPGSPLTASITCILFFCIEALQGNEHQALRLFDHARKAAFATVPTNSNDTLTINAQSTLSMLSVQWAMFDDTVEDDIAETPDFNQLILAISQAQSELISLVSHAFDVWKASCRAKWAERSNTTNGQATQQLKSRQQSINNAFNHWHTRFKAYTAQLSPSNESSQHRMASSTLIIWFNAMATWLTGAPVKSEMIYDKFLSRFESIVTEASRVIDSFEKEDQPVSFTFELGVVPPLYLAILLCRHPVPRRQALGLLRRAPAQEGLWRRAIIVRACERLIELEEGTDGFIADMPEGLGQRPIPEAMRCKTVKISLRATGQDGRLGNYVEYYSEPYGVDGAWSVYQQFFCT